MVTVARGVKWSAPKDIIRGQQIAQEAFLLSKGDNLRPDFPGAVISREVKGGLAMTVGGREI